MLKIVIIRWMLLNDAIIDLLYVENISQIEFIKKNLCIRISVYNRSSKRNLPFESRSVIRREIEQILTPLLEE